MKGPTHDAQPHVDDHFVRDGARVEVVDGHLVMAPPAEEPHATAHFSLTYVLAAHVTADYRGAVDMLTRTSITSDFAPDASVFPAAPDPHTGRRQLEELAFEIASTQPLESATDKARELARRGVRRVFCVLLKRGKLLEWSRETDGWSPLADTAEIDDRCFVRPIPVHALLDATAADDAVIRALLTRGHPLLRELEAAAEASGRSASRQSRREGLEQGLEQGRAAQRTALLAVLRARGLAPTEAEIAIIAACADLDTLTEWMVKAATASSVDDVLG